MLITDAKMMKSRSNFNIATMKDKRRFQKSIISCTAPCAELTK